MLKKLSLALTLLCFLSVTSLQASIPMIFSWGGEVIHKVTEFPDTETFVNVEKRYFDAGIKYKQISIFFIPVWNYDAKWCGYISDKLYIDLSKDDLQEYADYAKVKLPDGMPIPFWEKIGGKLLFAALLLLYILYSFSSSSDEETA